ncbi:MAG TPA: hypothetical protein VM368_09835 [Flavisolibacter sp.]|nr:hypothetical protein [Flavisolibacter sp.]
MATGIKKTGYGGLATLVVKDISTPIQRDRDHALFYSAGFIPVLMKLTLETNLVGFKTFSSGLKRLNKKALEMERIFLKTYLKKTG